MNFKFLKVQIIQLKKKIEKKKGRKEKTRKKNEKTAQRAGPLVDWVLLPCAEPRIGSALGGE
jgi:hypothetical protein